MHLDLLNLMRLPGPTVHACLGWDGIPSLVPVICTPQLDGIHKLADVALDPTVNVTDEDT